MTEAVATDVDIAVLGITGRRVDWRPGTRDAAAERRPLASRPGFLLAVDQMAASAAVIVAFFSRFGAAEFRAEFTASWYSVVLLPAMWLVAMSVAGAYDTRVLAVGAEEFRRVGNAGVWLLAGVAVESYLTKMELSRGLLALTIVLVTVMSTGARWLARRSLHRRIDRGHALHDVIAVGSTTEVRDLVRHMRRFPRSGFRVVGACVPDPVASLDCGLAVIPVVGTIASAAEAVRSLGADMMVVAGAGALSGAELRTLSWDLEGTGVQLVVAPAVTELAGPRIGVRELHGLPLLHVDEPRLSGVATAAKSVIDRVSAAALLLALSPLLIGLGVAIRLTSPGPAIFRQTRVGRDGRTFTLLKFRTMYEDAEQQREALARRNEHDGLLFKVREDPRVTPIGRWLRRHSFDELPQLWNVLRGAMSLVGPRPALPDEVARYARDVKRRLMVKPGMTGLWQVSGRSDLGWDEGVRLDLYYVENWSVALDALILARTIASVAVGKGAY